MVLELVGFTAFLAAIVLVGPALTVYNERVPSGRGPRLAALVFLCFVAAILIACVVFIYQNPEVADFNGP
jgi:phosphatidylserine synthase